MAKSSDIASSSPKAFCRDGDYVVPSYNVMGRKLTEGEVIGSEVRINKLAQSMAKHAQRNGATRLPTPAVQIIKDPKPQKNKKKSVANVLSSPLPATPTLKVTHPSDISVVFHNRFGKIKLSVVAVLEEETALALIFKDDDEVRFMPEAGDEFTIVVDEGRETKVYFPGVVFTWVDGVERIMILFKNE
jgi:hypothetical protein